jgi:hypothetical protein
MNDAGMDGEELLDRVRALRATGRTPKEIARALGLRPAQVVPWLGTSPPKPTPARPNASSPAAG